ncbi:hypothetical protein [Dankookia sp. P2]|uniref:hypothetical protein n=1 Tax=Dankookia sp. P2 TaxID=3423955 RepID=UPI003D66A34A
MGGETSAAHPLRLPPADECVPSLVLTAIHADKIEAAGQTHPAPPPDTVVTPRLQGIHAQDQGQGSATLNHDAQAAEMARLTQALHDAKEVHAADIERLRVQHAAEMQRLVEALWQAQDTARAASALPKRAKETPALEARPTSNVQPKALPAWQARFMGWGEVSLFGRACAALKQIGQRWAAAFRAWG